MTKDTVTEIVLNGVRWSSNILTELLSNFGRTMPPAARVKLHDAVVSLSECAEIIRRGE